MTGNCERTDCSKCRGYFTTALHKTVSDAIISAWKENGGQDYEIQTMH